MNEELEAFRDALRQAGQPWSRRGVIICGAGIVGLLISQIAPSQPVVLVALAVSFAVMMVGWVFLVIAFLKRRRWARAQRLIEPPLSVDPDPS
jgi:Flp pilus assembly protein TadB